MEISSKHLRDLNSSITHDPAIDGSEEEPVIMENDTSRGPKEMEFIIGQTFYRSGHFRDALKEFSIMKNFEIQRIKTDSRRVITKCQYKDYTWRMHAFIENGAEIFTIRKYYKKHSCSMPWSIKNHMQAKSWR